MSLIWVLKVISAVIVTTLFSLLLPEGKISSFVKPFFAFAVLTVILIPVGSLTEGVETLSFSADYNQNADVDLLDGIYLLRYDNIRKKCLEIVDLCGISCKDVIIQYNVDDNYGFTVTGAEINVLLNGTSDSETISDKLKNLTVSVSDYLGIDETRVKINVED